MNINESLLDCWLTSSNMEQSTCSCSKEEIKSILNATCSGFDSVCAWESKRVEKIYGEEARLICYGPRKAYKNLEAAH